jgi:hypothetical protein
VRLSTTTLDACYGHDCGWGASPKPTATAMPSRRVAARQNPWVTTANEVFSLSAVPLLRARRNSILPSE